MYIAQVVDFKVTNMYNLPSIPPEFLNGMGSVYHNLESNPRGVGYGWRYEGGDFLPPVDVSPSFGRIITVLAYRRRFTQAERIAIKMASRGQLEGMTNAQAAAVASDLDDLLAAGYVHLDRPDTISGTQGLEALGLIGVGRGAEILTPSAYSTELQLESRVAIGLSAIPTDKEISTNGGKGYTTVDQYFKENPRV